MYGRQSGKDLHSIQSGPPKTESNEIDLFPFSSFSSIWFQVNKEGGKGKASIALTHTLALILLSQVRIFRPLFFP